MYKKLFGQTLIYGIGAILPRLINFGLNPIYINQIEVEEFSKITQLYAIASFLNIILTFGFETAFFRFSTKENQSQNIFSTTFWFLFSTSFLFLILVYAFNPFLARILDYEDTPYYLIWFAWIILLDTLMVAPFAWLRLNEKSLYFSAVKVFQSLAQTLIILSFFFYFNPNQLVLFNIENKIEYPFVGNLLGSFVGILLLIPIFLKIKFKMNLDLLKSMIPYAFPVMLAGLAFALNENLDKTIQRAFLSAEEAGAYGGCYKLAVLMTLFVTAYRLGVEPFLFKRSVHKDAKQNYADIVLFFTIIGSVFVLAIVVNLPWLKQLLVPNQSYWIAIDIVPIILVANLFFGIYVALSTWYKVTDRTKVGMYISWIGAGITVGFNFLLMPKFGFIISAWATLIAYACMMVISYIWGQKVYPIPYNSSKILGYIFGMIFLLLFNQMFVNNIIIGNLLLLFYIAVVLFIEAKTIKIIVK